MLSKKGYRQACPETSSEVVECRVGIRIRESMVPVTVIAWAMQAVAVISELSWKRIGAVNSQFRQGNGYLQLSPGGSVSFYTRITSPFAL